MGSNQGGSRGEVFRGKVLGSGGVRQVPGSTQQVMSGGGEGTNGALFDGKGVIPDRAAAGTGADAEVVPEMARVAAGTGAGTTPVVGGAAQAAGAGAEAAAAGAGAAAQCNDGADAGSGIRSWNGWPHVCAFLGIR